MFTATLSENAKTSCLKYMRSVDCGFELTAIAALHRDRRQKADAARPDAVLYACHRGEFDGLIRFNAQGQKNRRLTEFLDNSDFNQAVIYVSSSTRARALQKLMTEWCFPCIALTANMPVEERMRHFIQFKEVKTRILITTQVMGRGVDVEKVNMVVNYDFPPSSNDYLHRVGRAGRFGTNGVTMSFVSTEEDEKVLAEVESRFETHMHEIKGAITKEALVV